MAQIYDNIQTKFTDGLKGIISNSQVKNEVEHYFGHSFLIDKDIVEMTAIPDVYKIKESKKTRFSKLIRGIHDRKVFMYFIDLFETIDEITQVEVEYFTD